MLTAKMKQVSFTLLIIILMSPIDPIQGRSSVLLEAWLTKCFKKGFEVLTNSPVIIPLNHCESAQLPKNLTSVFELETLCLDYYIFGCQMARLEIFCNEGIKQALAEASCKDLEIDLDVTNRAFECCVSCSGGIAEASLNTKCLSLQDDHADRSRRFCCRQTVSGLNKVDVNVTLTESTLVLPSENNSIDEISKLVSENDLKINSSLFNIMGENSTDSVTSVTESVNGTSNENVTSTTIEPEKKVESNVTESDVSSTTPEPISTEELTPKPVDPSTTVPATVRAIACSKGYQLSSNSNKCEDIDECLNADPCPDSECFNLPGAYKCCPFGTEIDQKTSECVYADYCEKDDYRCLQSADDQHYCVNYFVGRKCIDKIEEGYRFLKGESGILELVDKKDESSPRYLEVTVKNITLQDTPYENHGLIYVHLPKNVQCEWDFKLNDVWSPNKYDKITKDQFQSKTSESLRFKQIKVWINGQVKPQSIATSVTCSRDSKPFYRNNIYFTFSPASKN